MSVVKDGLDEKPDRIKITIRYPAEAQNTTAGGIRSITVSALDLWRNLNPEDRAGLWAASQWTGAPLHSRFMGEGAPAPDPSDRGAVRIAEKIAAQLTWTPGAFTPYPNMEEAILAARTVRQLMATLGAPAVRLLDTVMSRLHCATRQSGEGSLTSRAELETLLAFLRGG